MSPTEWLLFPGQIDAAAHALREAARRCPQFHAFFIHCTVEAEAETDSAVRDAGPRLKCLSHVLLLLIPSRLRCLSSVNGVNNRFFGCLEGARSWCGMSMQPLLAEPLLR